MRTPLFFILALLAFSNTYSQDLTRTADSITTEGKRLYRSEITSWYGTDAFQLRYQNDGTVGGYFSYEENDQTTKCIFYSKSDTPSVISTIVFNGAYSLASAEVDMAKRPFTSKESEIYLIRKKTLDEMNSDTMFTSYPDASLNLVPLITDEYKRVYILTGPHSNGVILFGNDYLLTFDKENKLISKKKLHKGTIAIEYGKGKGETEAIFHSHLPEYSEFMTATDVCTMMLYETFANCETSYVMSKDYMSIWSVKQNQLFIMTMEAFRKISGKK